MRMIRTRQYKYVLNIAHPLAFPFASDLYQSKTWQGVLARQDAFLGDRAVSQYVNRPREELYDLASDPHEIKNLAADPQHAETLSELRDRLKSWRLATKDPWIVKDKYE
jgi:N-sulfoglucosamine sulfohydrolase